MNSAQFVQIERELSRLGVTVYGVGEWGGAVYVWIPDGLGDTRAVRLDPETHKLLNGSAATNHVASSDDRVEKPAVSFA